MNTSTPLERPKLKVINLFGGPGNGKSGTRSGLFWLMKMVGMSVEEVSEYAKYLVLSGRTWQLQEEQLYLFSKQHHKQLVVQRAGYEYAVTDSPLQLCAFYAPKDYYPAFDPLVNNIFESFENHNFFLSLRHNENPEKYEQRGRVQSREESLQVESQLREFLAKKNITYTDVEVDAFTPWRILDKVAPGVAPWPRFD